MWLMIFQNSSWRRAVNICVGGVWVTKNTKSPTKSKRWGVSGSKMSRFCLALGHVSLEWLAMPHTQVTCGVGAGDQSAFPHDPLPGSLSRVASPQLLPVGRIWTKDRSPTGFRHSTTWTPLNDSTTDLEALNNLDWRRCCAVRCLCQSSLNTVQRFGTGHNLIFHFIQNPIFSIA
jgi:hypothetical protein